MFRNYAATEKDIKAIEEALEQVWDSRMDFIFLDRTKIKHATVVSYDSKYVYVWQANPIKLLKIPHRLTISDKWQHAWWASLVSKKIEKYLPQEIRKSTRFEIPIISGGLLTPFVQLQKAKKVVGNPYVTKESYSATIIHEFGHVYWNSFKLWWYSNKKENLELLTTVKKLYQNKPNDKLNTSFRLPTNPNMGEVFAYCAEYCAANIFWPSYKKALDKFATKYITRLVDEEKIKVLDREDSALEPSRNPHNFAIVVGKLITDKYPKTWSQILTLTARVSF